MSQHNVQRSSAENSGGVMKRKRTKDANSQFKSINPDEFGQDRRVVNTPSNNQQVAPTREEFDSHADKSTRYDNKRSYNNELDSQEQFLAAAPSQKVNQQQYEDEILREVDFGIEPEPTISIGNGRQGNQIQATMTSIESADQLLRNSQPRMNQTKAPIVKGSLMDLGVNQMSASSSKASLTKRQKAFQQKMIGKIRPQNAQQEKAMKDRIMKELFEQERNALIQGSYAMNQDSLDIKKSQFSNVKMYGKLTDQEIEEREKTNKYFQIKGRFLQKVQDMEYDQSMVDKKKELAKKMNDLGGDMEESDLDDLDQQQVLAQLFQDEKFRYSSNTDDEDKKYVHKKNKNIMFWKNQYRRKHILKLWRRAFSLAHTAGRIINQISSVQTKLQYFGRQMLSRSQADLQKEMNKFKGDQVISRFLINPHGFFKKIWDVIMIVLLLYTATFVPYKISFKDDIHESGASQFDLLVDILFGMDIIVNFITPYEKYDGSLQTNHKKIARGYFFGAFFIDFVACIPMQVFTIGQEEGGEDHGQDGQTKLVRLARLQRLYKLFRIFRVVKIIKISKYEGPIQKLIAKLDINPSMSRVIIVTISAFFSVHLFACFFFLSAKMNDYGVNTWVYQTGALAEKEFFRYCLSIYWAFQTLTTVGYGDFGAYSSEEILITTVWMILGVAFYTFVIAALTSLITAEGTHEDGLKLKLEAFDIFAQESGLDPRLHKNVRQFLQNNYTDVFIKVEVDQMIDELPATMKEEVLFFQFGKLIDDFSFFSDLDTNCIWNIMRILKKVTFERFDTVYHDGAFSETVYLIYAGQVKLLAENGFAFALFRKGDHFGETDVFCGTRRNGTAQAQDNCMLYKLNKSDLEQVLLSFPATRKTMLNEAVDKHSKLINDRFRALKKSPLYGRNSQISKKSLESLQRLKQFNADVKEKRAQFRKMKTMGQDCCEGDKLVGVEYLEWCEKKEREDEEIKRMEEEEKSSFLIETNQVSEEDQEEDNTKELKIQALNALVIKQHDSTPGFTENVQEMIKTLGSDEDSEDKDLQQSKDQHKQMDSLLIQYQNTNEGPAQDKTGEVATAEVQKRLVSGLRRSMKEYQVLRKSVIEELPNFQNIKDENEILQDEDIGDEVAETSLEVLCSFNEDMKVLAMNAFQLQELLTLSLEENDAHLEWLQSLESTTVTIGESLTTVVQNIDEMGGLQGLEQSMPSQKGSRLGQVMADDQRLPVSNNQEVQL